MAGTVEQGVGEQTEGTSVAFNSGATAERGKRRTFEGVVTSAKMDKTITVQRTYRRPHTKYGKFTKRYTKLKAHDEKNEAREGDLVEITETRPLSKTKRYRLVRVVRKAAQ